MFSWICPQCGREVPPAYSECPDCAKKAQGEAAPAAASPPAATPVAPAASPPAPVAAAAPLVPTAPARKAGLPTWLMTIVFTLAFGGLFAAFYFGVQLLKQPVAQSQPAPESPKPVASMPAPAAKTNPLQKHIEITGVRLTQDKAHKTEARFVVVNHSAAEIADLTGTVNILAKTARERGALATFTFKVPSLGPYESKDLTTTVDTKLQVYELPDWQNIEIDLTITAP